jgi:hypothetical protein
MIPIAGGSVPCAARLILSKQRIRPDADGLGRLGWRKDV